MESSVGGKESVEKIAEYVIHLTSEVGIVLGQMYSYRETLIASRYFRMYLLPGF